MRPSALSAAGRPELAAVPESAHLELRQRQEQRAAACCWQGHVVSEGQGGPAVPIPERAKRGAGDAEGERCR